MRPVTIRRMSAWSFVILLLGGRSAAAQRPPDPAITGVVVDATGGALPRAGVQLTDPAGATVQSLVTDPIGAFRSERVPPGRYDIRVTLDGFRPGGEPRNSLEGAGYADVDLRASRNVTFAKDTPQARTVTLALDAFNLVNRVNYSTCLGTLASPLFGRLFLGLFARQGT
jgi:hypothetical protein